MGVSTYMKKSLAWFVVVLFSLVLVTPSAFVQVEGSEKSPPQVEKSVFRNIVVKGKDGEYTVEGEASTMNGSFYYLVEDGHFEFVPETRVTTAEKHPKWASFDIKINIPKAKLPSNGTVAVYFYEKDQSGNMIHTQAVVLEEFY